MTLDALTDEALRAAWHAANDAIDAAYWRFCRQARALPPVLAVPEAYARRAAIEAEQARRRERPA